MRDARIAARPTLAAWVDEYRAIEDDYLCALANYGVELAPCGYLAAETAQALARVCAKGALVRNGGASVVAGRLSSACVACTGGEGSKTFMLSLECNRQCFFCFNANQANFERGLSYSDAWKCELNAFLAQPQPVTHVALTGGEPLLHADEATAFFARVSEVRPKAHTRLYTAGDFLDEGLCERLALAGLRELRLSVKLEGADAASDRRCVREALDRLTLAKRFIPDVMVEMPAVPGTQEAMRMLLRGLDDVGALGINVLELGYPMGDWAPFAARGLQVKNPPYAVVYNYDYAAGLPIAGSELLGLELVEFALDEGLKVGVHYCSLENKNRDQVLRQNSALAVADEALARSLWGAYELDAEDFFLKTLKVFDGDVAPARRALAKAGVPGRYVASDDACLCVHPRFREVLTLCDVVVATSFNVVEGEGSQATVRELCLEAESDKRDE